MDTLRELAQHGRAGGIFGIAAGIVAAGFYNGEDVWSPKGLGLAGLMVLSGLFLIVQGATLVARRAVSPRLSKEALTSLLSEGRPVTLCLDCRAEIIVPPCEYCAKSSSCMEIRNASDVDTARTLLGLDSAGPMS